jgi:predicted nuclease with TOPRIM domain
LGKNFMPLFANIEKWISEHGSAAILKERLLLASDKYAALEEKLSDLRSQHEELRLKNANLADENRRLRGELDDLRKKSQVGVEVVRVRSRRDRFAGL